MVSVCRTYTRFWLLTLHLSLNRLAILGLTWQYTSGQVAFDVYEAQSAALASDATALNPIPEKLKGSLPQADDSSIRVIESDLRFTLYRHWSLETAMFHTAYVAAKLSIWKESGMSKLRGLLAKMGFSLSNCRQTYEHMDLDLRNVLVNRMDAIAREYALTELLYRSFLRSFGFRSAPLSAADAVEGINALLQAAYGVLLEIDTPGMTFAAACNYEKDAKFKSAVGNGGTDLFGARRTWNLAGEGGDDDGPKKDLWARNFFAAYNALDTSRPENIDLLQASLSLSKSLHHAVVSCGISIIEKHAIRTLRSFRLVILTDGPDLALFSNPSVLTRLAMWLIDALRDSMIEVEKRNAQNRRARKKAKQDADALPSSDLPYTMPFVVAAMDQAKSTYTVVGVSGATDFGDVRRNQFGLAFQEAAEKSGATTQHDRFETSVVEVAAPHLKAFVDALYVKA